MEQIWKHVLLVCIFALNQHTLINGSSLKVDFPCPYNCHCVSAVQNPLLVELKCSSLDSLVKLVQYNPKQAIHIRKLDISHANIKKLNTDLINKMKNLQTLNVSHNQIIDLPKTIKLNQLTNISLEHNEISSISYWFFPKSTRYIDLSHNRIEELPENILNLPKLEELHVNGNRLKCSCYNHQVYKDLTEKDVLFDANECFDGYRMVKHTWKESTCISDILSDDVGSGEIYDLTNDTDAKNDDFDEFINVDVPTTKRTTPPSTTVAVTEQTTEHTVNVQISTESNNIQSSSDFYFGEDNSSANESISAEMEGSGEAELESDLEPQTEITATKSYNALYNEQFIPIEHVTTQENETVEELYTSSQSSNIDAASAEDDEASGSGEGIIPFEISPDDTAESKEIDEISSTSSPQPFPDVVPTVAIDDTTTTTTTTAAPVLTTTTTTTTLAPTTIATDPPTTTPPTTTTTTYIPVTTTTESEKTLVASIPQVPVPETSPEEEQPTTTVAVDIHVPIQPEKIKEVSAVQKIYVNCSEQACFETNAEHHSEEVNINEEFGQVIDKDPNKKPPFGTYIFLAVLVAVLMALIGYTVLKRRMNRPNPRNRRLSGGDDGRGGTELKDIEKNAALLNQENEKKSNGVVNENTPMISQDNATTEVADGAAVDTVDNAPNNLNKSSSDLPRNDSEKSLPSTAKPKNPNAAEKVKIVMSEITPKTPVLVSRQNVGNEIVITPNLDQRIPTTSSN